MILANSGLLAPRVGSVWECDCRTQWEVQRYTPPDQPAANSDTSFLRYVVRAKRLLNRRAVLDLLAKDLAGNRTGDEVSLWRADVLSVLKYLEDHHMARWGEGPVQDEQVP